MSPYNRWAFHHVDEIVPAVTVENDADAVAKLERASKSLDASLLGELFLRATRTDAIVILAEGRIAFEWYANGNGPETLHILMSATKSVTGLVARTLAERGMLDLDALVTDYVPEVSDTPYAAASIQHLLDMRADAPLNDADGAAYASATGWEPAEDGAGIAGLHEFFATFTGKPGVHGGPFRYLSANTDLLGWALERATGEPFASLVSTLLWKPMGAERDAFVTTDPTGAARAAGGLCATARDFARIGQLLVDDGMSRGNRVLPPSVVDDLAAAGDAAAWRDGEWGKPFSAISKRMRYRNGWYAIDDEPNMLFAMGIHGQNLFVDRANKLVVAKFSSWAKATDYVLLPLTHMAIETIRRLASGT